MKKHILTLSILVCSCILFAQNENPFSQFGYEAPVMQVKEPPATNNDTLFIIGNQNPNSDIRWLVIDPKNQLIRLYSAEGIEVGSENLEVYTTARWLVPDPAGQYYSPYKAMGNNPTNNYDPDGRLVIFINGYMPLEGRYDMNSSELKNYWGGMASDFKSYLSDNNDVYIDGHTSNPVSSASRRSSMGYEAGKDFQPALHPGETIKIVAHSQGAAYSEGFVKALNENGYNVEVVYALEPYNAKGINFNENQRLIQYHSGSDLIAPYSLLKGADQSFYPREDWFNLTLNYYFQSHQISNLRGWIFDPNKRINRFTYTIEAGPVESLGWEYE